MIAILLDALCLLAREREVCGHQPTHKNKYDQQ
jgi:hypothetical protein